MENQSKRKNNHSGGPKWKESGKLIPGSRGLLITNSITGKYKEAMQEVLFILRQHSDKFYPEDSDDVKEGGVDHNDTEQMLRNELKELNEKFNRFVPGPCISKGLNYVHFKNFKDVPSKYVQEIFQEIKNHKSYSARFLSKVVPVDYICNANEKDLENIFKKLITKEFPLSFVNSHNGDDKVQTYVNKDEEKEREKDNGYRGKDEKEEKEEAKEDVKLNGFDMEGQEGVTWALEFKSTNSSALGRQQVLDMVTKLIGNRYKVDLKKPEKLVIVHVVKEDGLEVPKEGEWTVCGETGEDSKWFTHQSQEWMHNPEEKVYFHIKSQTIVPDLSLVEYDEESTVSELKNLEVRNVSKRDLGVEQSDGDEEEEEYENCPSDKEEEAVDDNEENEGDGSDSEDFSMDFNKDLIAVTVSRKGNYEGKMENEDRYITKECMSIQYVSNSDALCYFSGVFDGHYGPKCSQYAIDHVKNNILTVFRQNIKSNPSWFKRRKIFSKNTVNYKLNEFVSNNTVPSGGDSSNFTNASVTSSSSSLISNTSGSSSGSLLDLITSGSSRDKDKDKDDKKEKEEKEIPKDVNVLLYSIHKGIEMLDNNFCSMAKKDAVFDGSTLNMVFLYGPDLSGNLKLIAGNLGDSRSILCVRDGDECVAKDLTLDHKPNHLPELERVVKNGGTVEYLQNSWRAVLKKKNGIVCALSTSRSLGDYIMKSPNKIISSNVELFVHDFNFNDFLFIVQCTDGIVDALTSQEVVDIVVKCFEMGYDAERSAEEVVKVAEQLGSQDDKTCTIIYFSWNHYLLNKNKDNSEVDSNNTLEPDNSSVSSPFGLIISLDGLGTGAGTSVSSSTARADTGYPVTTSNTASAGFTGESLFNRNFGGEREGKEEESEDDDIFDAI